MTVVGIDLATEKGETGLCILNEDKIITKLVKSDDEIIKEINSIKPEVVAIDAPLSWPKKGIMRETEILLRKLGIRVFPPLMQGMKRLTERGIRLKNLLKYKVIEVYPGLFYDQFKIKRRNNQKELKMVLKRFGIVITQDLCQHELDAVVCALIGKFYLERKTIKIGEIITVKGE